MGEKLALEGGQPAVPKHLVEHFWQRYRKCSQEEIDAVVEVLKSGHLSIAADKGMPNTMALGEEFAAYVGSKYCLVTSTGTASLHCALAGVGVGPGDEVIMPSHTFIATAHAALHHNAVPVFVDIDRITYNIDPAKIEAKITDRTKAIMPVHIYGLPCDMDPINELARKYGLKVVEDSAQGYGASYKGRKAGTLGDAAGFAMTPTKQLVAGEGGLMTTNSEEVYRKASKVRYFGETEPELTADRSCLAYEVGWNYKLPEAITALARVRLRHLDEYMGCIQQSAARLTKRLENREGVIVPKVPEDGSHGYYAFPVQIDPEKLNVDAEPGKIRNAVMKALKAENINVGRWQKIPVPAQPMWQNMMAYGKGCPWKCHGGDVRYDIDEYPMAWEMLEKSFILWGVAPPDEFERVDYYAQAFEKVFANIEKVVDLYDKTEKYVPLTDRMAAVRNGNWKVLQ